MGGNINKKKSWDPSSGKSQKLLWRRENEAIEERKRIEERRKERAEERRIQALQQLQDNVSGTLSMQRVDWMYSAPNPENKVGQEREAYLLGKRIDKLSKAIVQHESALDSRGSTQVEMKVKPMEVKIPFRLPRWSVKNKCLERARRQKESRAQERIGRIKESIQRQTRDRNDKERHNTLTLGTIRLGLEINHQ